MAAHFGALLEVRAVFARHQRANGLSNELNAFEGSKTGSTSEAIRNMGMEDGGFRCQSELLGQSTCYGKATV
jgi:hypothetical protein